jgi:aspartyl-tRNA(Asn)/glutamyl-tRNA(Gln) amidotransferase subunit A
MTPTIRDRAQATVSDSKNLRIGVPTEYNIAEISSEVREAWVQVLELLQSLGHTIVPISLPTTKHALSAYYVLAPAEASSNLAKYDGVRYGKQASGLDGTDGVLFSRSRGEGFGAEVKRRILLGSYTLSAEAISNYFIRAQRVRRLVQQDFDRVFRSSNPLSKTYSTTRKDEGVDFIICPTAPTLAPTLKEVTKQSPIQSYMNDVFTVPASLAGLPALSVPTKRPEVGFPRGVGIQILGQYGDDDNVLELGVEFDKYFSARQ